jgi:hypothetical protein
MKSKLMIFCVCLLSVSFSSVHAQKSSAILKLGVNLANVSINNDGDIDDAKTLTSFQAGIFADLKLLPILYLQPGIVFTGKGTKTQSGTEGSANWYRASSNPYYLEVPVNLVLKTPTGAVKFFGGAGPYLGIGIAGKNKVKGSILGTAFASEEKIKFSNDDPSTLDEEEGAGFGILKRFDYGLNGLVGIETKNMVVSANYGFGLAKLQSGDGSGDDNNNKHRVLSFTLGFKL